MCIISIINVKLNKTHFDLLFFFFLILDSYHEAEQETFSCLSVVDQDSLGRGKRKKKSNFRHFDLSGDSDNGT